VSQRLPYPTLSSFLLTVIVMCLFAPAPSMVFAQDAVVPAPDQPSQNGKNAFHTPEQRKTAMRAADLFVPKATGEADIASGPEQDKKQFKFHFNDKLICDFATPGDRMGGTTAKFGCIVTRVESADGTVQTLTPEMEDKDPIKVKYGANDNEVYAEIVSTRLLWSIGYYDDTWYSVHVECHNCPANLHTGAGPTSTQIFEPAVIVRKFPWKKMTEDGNDDEGRSWKELDTDNGRPTYERDGLKLMGAFIQHSDNKPPQQRLTCQKVSVDTSTQPPTTTCDKSVMLVQDVGASFGSGGWFTFNGSAKMNLDNWSHKKLWSSVGTEPAPHACRASLRKSLAAKDGLINPSISEEGRRLDAGLMCQLSDAQIDALFRNSHVAEMPKYHNKDGSFKPGITEDKVLVDWAKAFKNKREQLSSGRCEWKEKPGDLAVVENPMGLPVVPNFCATKPF
jgi:hypothetical protein